MRIKAYFGKSVDEAIAQARHELGDDALLLNTRKVPGQAGLRGGYEVMFGSADAPGNGRGGRFCSEPAPAEIAKPAPTPVAIAGNSATGTSPAPVIGAAPKVIAPTGNASGELDRIQAQMDEIRSLLVRSNASRLGIGRTVPELADVYARLMASEWDAAMAKDIVDRLEALMATDAFFLRSGNSRETANRWKSMRFDAHRFESFVRAELAERIRIDTRLGSAMAVVGPTGAGKTTSLMKIAASQVALGKPVRILTLDSSRAVRESRKLQFFASKYGDRGGDAVSSPEALPALIADARKREMVLIDTPGYAGNVGLEAGIFAKCDDRDGCSSGGSRLHAGGRSEPLDPALQSVFSLPSSGDETGRDRGARFGCLGGGTRGIESFVLDRRAHPVAGEIRPSVEIDLLAMAMGQETARAECA